MDNAFGSDNNETKEHERGETSDDDQDEANPLGDLPYDARLIVEGEVELSTAQREAAGHYLWELKNAGRDYTSNAVLVRDDVEAIEPPSELGYDVPQLDVILAACFLQWGGGPPDNATIRAMGAVEQRALLRYLSKEWSYCGAASGASSGAARSAQVFLDFKEKAIEMNGGAKPDEDFWREHFKVPHKTYHEMDDDDKRFYERLKYIVMCPGQMEEERLWVTNNKKWLEDSGVFSAWEKHRASADFVQERGWALKPGEVSQRGDTDLISDLNARLQCQEFIDDKGKRCRVLVVRWHQTLGENVALCYEARLADPTKNLKQSYYVSRLVPVSFAMTIEDVDDAIARTPQEKKPKPKPESNESKLKRKRDAMRKKRAKKATAAKKK